jgi:hypothetical protein
MDFGIDLKLDQIFLRGSGQAESAFLRGFLSPSITGKRLRMTQRKLQAARAFAFQPPMISPMSSIPTSG